MPKKYILLSIASLFLLAPLVAEAITINAPGSATTLNDLLNIVIGFSLKIVLPLAVITLLVAAFFIVRGKDSAGGVQKGRQILTYGLVGLAVVILGAGSGALLKNIFHTQLPEKEEIPGITYKMPSDYGFPNWPPSAVSFWADSIAKSIENLKQQLAEAEQKGDQEKTQFLKEEIKNQEEIQRSLTLWNKNLFEIEMGTSITDNASDKEWKDFFDSDNGVDFLKKYGIKGEGDWYQMADGAKYNIKTKEFIDSSGKSFTDTQLLGDGAVISCSK